MEESLHNDEEYSTFIQKWHMNNKVKIDESKLVFNPFSQDLVIEASLRVDSVAKVKDEHGNLIPASAVIEKAKSTKVYLSAKNRDRVMQMSSGGQAMYLYIIHSMEPGKDYITIVPEWYQAKAKKGSRNSYLRAIDELITEGYITPTIYKYVYWVNPILLFNGSRPDKYPDNVLVKNTYVGYSKTSKVKLEKVSKMPTKQL